MCCRHAAGFPPEPNQSRSAAPDRLGRALNGPEKIREHAPDQMFRLGALEALVGYAARGGHVVLVGRDAMSSEASGGARDSTAIQRDDVGRGNGRLDHRRHVRTEGRDAAHARKPALRELHGHMVHHLSGPGTPGTRVDDRQTDAATRAGAPSEEGRGKVVHSSFVRDTFCCCRQCSTRPRLSPHGRSPYMLTLDADQVNDNHGSGLRARATATM